MARSKTNGRSHVDGDIDTMLPSYDFTNAVRGQTAKRYAEGTNIVARAVVEATRKNGAKSIIGGGDSVKALNQAGLGDQVTFMSTGGGASLEFLEGKVLPGVAVLTDK